MPGTAFAPAHTHTDPNRTRRTGDTSDRSPTTRTRQLKRNDQWAGLTRDGDARRRVAAHRRGGRPRQPASLHTCAVTDEPPQFQTFTARNGPHWRVPAGNADSRAVGGARRDDTGPGTQRSTPHGRQRNGLVGRRSTPHPKSGGHTTLKSGVHFFMTSKTRSNAFQFDLR